MHAAVNYVINNDFQNFGLYCGCMLTNVGYNVYKHSINISIFSYSQYAKTPEKYFILGFTLQQQK